MEITESNLIESIKELKENYFAVCLKLEFEAEGSSIDEAIFLADLAQKTELNLTVKIGGCEALRDICDAKEINAKNIIAPMIESPYSLFKFTHAVENIFSDNINLFINIETITGYNNINKIISMQEFSVLKGIVLGRSDLAASLGLSKIDVNSEQIFRITKEISEKTKILKKDFIVGGGISPNSIEFLTKIPYLTNFETRKIVFNKNLLKYKNLTANAIKKAIEFEIEWLEFKKYKFNGNNKNTEKRITLLKNLINKADTVL